jgi:hypothetical protein
MAKTQEFKIFGNVFSDEGGVSKSRSGLTVEALDKDLLYDDRLGATITNDDGYFEIVYSEKDFKELFFEKRPDIYLRIKNKEGKVIYTTQDKVRYGAANTEFFKIVLPDILYYEEVESERLQFKNLISLNPNYFGTLDDSVMLEEFNPVFEVKGNTKYEELNCIGLLPEQDLFEAVLEVKLPYGYKGSLCTDGSKEYVSFYVDYGDGAGYTSVGAPAEVNVHDLIAVSKGHIYYAVRKPFIPKNIKWCMDPQIVKVRAILSWEKVPSGPDYIPVWGNIVEASVQIRPKKIYFIHPIPLHAYQVQVKPELIHPEIPYEEIIPQPYPLVENITYIGDKKEISEVLANSVKAEEAMLKDKTIEKERSEFKKLISENLNYFGSISEKKNLDELKADIAKLPTGTLENLFPNLGIVWEKLIPVKPFLFNVGFEEMTCLGLYPEEDLLEAIISIKRPSGYSGSLCTLGSNEYVAFYIDWGTGLGFEYVTTSMVNVHDIPEAANSPIQYAVKAKIPDIKPRLKDCNIEHIVKVKAILSWNQDPTPYGHGYKPPWGNVLTRRIQIRPKTAVKCSINVINEIHVDHIDKAGSTEGQAIKVNSSNVTVPFVFDRPFGRYIAVWADIPDGIGYDSYRFSYREDTSTSWINITDKVRYPKALFGMDYRVPDENGWLSIKDYKKDQEYYPLQALIHWNSGALNGLYHLKLELANLATNTISPQASEVPIYLDNKGIELKTFGGTDLNLPAEGIVVKDKSGKYRKCSTFKGGEEILIYGNFKDDFFLNYNLILFGGNLPASGINLTDPVHGIFVRYDSGKTGIGNTGVTGAVNNGSGVELLSVNLCNTIPSNKHVNCAYGFRIAIRDRAIVGGLSGYVFDTYHHSRQAFTTFNWDPTGCS